MSEHIIIFDEPPLEFRYGQQTAHPRDGLALFGPYDTDLPERPSHLSYIVLGTDEGIAKFSNWAKLMAQPSVGAPDNNFRLWPPFPGFESAFCAKWHPEPVWSYAIDPTELHEAAFKRQQHERAFSVVEHYLRGLKIAYEMDAKIGVAVCVVPDEVWDNCRPESRVINPIGDSFSRKELKIRKTGQLGLLESYDPEQYKLSPDFRRQLKARSMEYEIPVQILRESTLRPNDEFQRGERQLTPLSDRMWNLSTTLYYKCGGKPWQLVTARDGVCYIGIAFRKTEEENTACCAAQMFLNSGDGVVFLGKFGPWYSPDTKQFHLDKEHAEKLLRGVLETYRNMGGKALTEIFLHSRSEISEEEFQGYENACPDGVKLVGVRVRDERFKAPRLYRPGTRPVLRGSFWRLSEKSGFLWGAGFKPRLASYDGWEVPVPMRIDVQYGDVPVERVAQDILGLTKLNYNACRIGDSEPVTVGFSNAVGEILIANPTVSARRPNFKYYI
jgi:hypothetical protein